MADRSKRKPGSGGEVLAARYLAMAPTTIARWAREGRSFRPVEASIRPEDEQCPAPEPGEGSGAP